MLKNFEKNGQMAKKSGQLATFEKKSGQRICQKCVKNVSKMGIFGPFWVFFGLFWVFFRKN